MLRILALAVTVILAAAGPVAAAKPVPFTIGQIAFQHQQPVEQQTPGGATQPDQTLWVINRTDCIWDADDQWLAAGYGYLEPGASRSISTCIIGDWAAHDAWGWAVVRRGPTPAISVRLSGGPTASCVRGPDYDYGSALPPIPDSNGGVGVIHTVTFTIRNPSDRRIHIDRAEFTLRMRGTGPESCGAYFEFGNPSWWYG
jgi:hypothetical protein